jgi:hypothetical protein
MRRAIAMFVAFLPIACTQARENLGVLDGFGNGRELHHVTDLIDGLHHGVVNGIVHHVTHEVAGDFEIVHR